MCATVDVVEGRSHSLRDHRAFHLALIAFVCVVVVLFSGSSSTRVAGTDWLTRQLDDCVEQFEARDHTPVPMLRLDTRFAEHLLDKLVEPDEPTDDDETKNYVLLRSDVAAFGSQTGLSESSADRALTPFRLLAFWSRGSPSA